MCIGPGYSSRRRSASPFPYYLTRVYATDSDTGSNGNFTFFLLSGDPALFSVNPQTGVVSLLQNLQYSIAPQYQFQVGARDAGGASTDSLMGISVFIESFLCLDDELD